MAVMDRVRGWLGMKPKASLDGGQINRLFRTSPTGSLHPDREIQYDIATVRARARALSVNDSTIAGYLMTAADNVVGHCGMQLQAKVANRNGDLATTTNAAIEAAWKDFGEPGNCTVDGRFSMTQFQRMLVQAKKVDGEVFIRIYRGSEYAHGIALQVIPADMLDERFDRQPDANGNEIRMGVELGPLGVPLAYHFFKRHPGDRYGASRERVRVDAAEIIHYRGPGQVGQTRGFSEFAPILFDALMLKGWVEAELVLARQAASKGIRYQATSEEAIQAYSAGLLKASGNELPETVELSPGLEQYITPGWEVVPYDPSIPNTGVEAFGRFIHRRMARGLGVASGTLTGDMSDATYSSMRTGLLPERDRWTAEQIDFATQVLIPIYRLWIGAALLKGAVRLDTRLGSQYYEVEFAGRGWSSVDPLKDRQADMLGIQMGVLSRSEIAADEGRDFEEVVRTLKHEQEIANTAGVNIQGEAAVTDRARQMTDAESGVSARIAAHSLRAIS
jgi:lambda family phage portal protein